MFKRFVAWLRFPWSMRFTLTSMLMTSLVLLAASLVILGWFGGRQLILASAQHEAQYSANITSLRLQHLLGPAAVALRMLSLDAIVTAKTTEQRLQRLPTLALELQANPLVSAVYVGYENGDFVLIRPLVLPELRKRLNAPSQAHYLVQVIERDAQSGMRGTHYFMNADLQSVLIRPVPEYRFDPRKRPWYQAAQSNYALNTSPPYVFFTTLQVGISISQRALGGQATVGLDLALEDLSKHLPSLQLTPGTELALVDGRGRVVAYRDMSKVLHPTEDGKVGLGSVAQLGVAPLMLLPADADAEASPYFRAAGKNWLGFVLQVDGHQQPLRLLMAVPMQELLHGFYDLMLRMMLLVSGLIVLFLAWCWWAGGKMGKHLEHLFLHARRVAYFDFSSALPVHTWVQEVAELQQAANNVGQTVEAFLEISRILGSESHMDNMLQQVLEKCVTATRCQAGAVYLWDAQQGLAQHAACFGCGCGSDPYFPYPLNVEISRKCHEGAAANLQVEFELRGRDGDLQGILVLLPGTSHEVYGPQFHNFVSRLTGMLAVAIETRQLIEAQRCLLDGMIKMLADAVDAKSPYTGGHSRRVPELALMLVDDLQAQSEGTYAAFKLSAQEYREFSLAAWLHDCGKITSPEDIIDKATKLEVVYNRIHEIRMRFEVLWRDAEIKRLQTVWAGVDAQRAKQICQETQQQLQEDFAFIAECNIGGEFLSAAAVQRLQELGARTWQRHFDDLQGLAHEELELRRQGRALPQTLPATEKLLADQPYHRIAWGAQRPAVERDDPHNTLGLDMRLPELRIHRGELYNLSIRRGTLTTEDRFIVNDHIVQTLVMLNSLPWPRGLENIPEIAANHHERMDGTGYPRRLVAAELPLTHRIMALVDVFEALTAADRPYKPPKTLSEALGIMATMSQQGHLDCELFLHFLHSNIWQDYAQRLLTPRQIDTVDVTALAARFAQNALSA